MEPGPGPRWVQTQLGCWFDSQPEPESEPAERLHTTASNPDALAALTEKPQNNVLGDAEPRF